VPMSCSIGIAMYPEHGAMSTMIAHVEAAVRATKGQGGATYAFFDSQSANRPQEQVGLLKDLREALAKGQLELYYQPKIHAPSGEITGAEALMRWHHPQRGMISPGVFIPIAERFGLIGALGNWVIDEACRQARTWRDDGLRMRVAINLSVYQLREAGLVERIATALKKHEIDPKLLTCEITESMAMDDAETTKEVFGKLRQLGVPISIDDFGTGASSLSQLRKLRPEELKIDRSFVLDLATSNDARAVVDAVVKLAQALSIKVVAEGVETEAQHQILRALGCQELQGYLFAKPMSAKALAAWAMNDIGPRSLGFRESLYVNTRPLAVH
jgi:EAL domain-containing protein (putative c-di-GMP-specific phosphodiesterase class I)